MNNTFDKLSYSEQLQELHNQYELAKKSTRKAEQKLIAANAKVGVAYTNMFPKIALTSSLGLETDKFTTLLSSPMFFVKPVKI